MKENTKNARINVRSITFTAVMAALVFVFTYTFKIPFVNGYTHIGDSMIFLAIVFLGYKKAPLAAGIGAGLADLIGGYSAWVAPTFIIKFFMALICALIMEKVIKNNRIVGYVVGSILGGAWQIVAYTVVKIFLFDKAYAFSSLPALAIQTVVGIVVAAVFIVVFNKTKITAKLKKMVG